MDDSPTGRKPEIPPVLSAQIKLLAASLAVIERYIPEMAPDDLNAFYQEAGPTLDRFQAVDERLWHGSIQAEYSRYADR